MKLSTATTAGSILLAVGTLTRRTRAIRAAATDANASSTRNRRTSLESSLLPPTKNNNVAERKRQRQQKARQTKRQQRRMEKEQQRKKKKYSSSWDKNYNVIVDSSLILTNNKPTVTSFCNPRSWDADIGILSCGSGKYCQQQESSYLGGVCVSFGGNNSNKRKKLEIPPQKSLPWQYLGQVFSRQRQQRQQTKPTLQECDPLDQIINANIGILTNACPNGQSCVENPASAMGGVCVGRFRSTHQRSLQANHYHDHAKTTTGDASDLMYLCEEDADEGNNSSMLYDCDCTNFDRETGTGMFSCVRKDVYCFEGFNQGCRDVCADLVEFSYVTQSFAILEVSYCLSFETPHAQNICYRSVLNDETNNPTCEFFVDDEECLCEEGYADCTDTASHSDFAGTAFPPILHDCAIYCDICEYYAYVDDTKNVTLPGYGNMNCYELSKLGKYGYIAEKRCTEINYLVAKACCAGYCDICGDGRYLTNHEASVTIPGLEGEYNCLDIYTSSLVDGTISNEECPVARAAANTTCCSAFVSHCDICGVGSYLAYPDAIVMIPDSNFTGNYKCADLYDSALHEQLIPPNLCPAIQTAVKTTCCTSTPYYCDICGRDSSFSNPNGTVSIPGMGDYDCRELFDAGLQHGSISKDDCPVVVAVASATCCTPNVWSCHICDYDGTLTHPNRTIDVPELGKATCSFFYYAGMNDGGTGGGEPIPPELCPVIQSIASGACCEFPCHICDVGSYLAYPNATVNIPFLLDNDTIRCEDLYFHDGSYNMDSNTTESQQRIDIPGGMCFSVTSVASPRCCKERCSLCQDDFNFNFSASVNLTTHEEVSCSYLGSLVNDNLLGCDAAFELARGTCCYNLLPNKTVDSSLSPNITTDESSETPSGTSDPTAEESSSSALLGFQTNICWLALSMWIGLCFVGH